MIYIENFIKVTFKFDEEIDTVNDSIKFNDVQQKIIEMIIEY